MIRKYVFFWNRDRDIVPKKYTYDYNWECAHINNFLFYTFHLTLIHVKQFSKVVILIYIPSTMYESNGCLTSLSTVSIVGLFNFSHSGGCVTVFHCSFNLKFSNDYCFFLFTGHLVSSLWSAYWNLWSFFLSSELIICMQISFPTLFVPFSLSKWYLWMSRSFFYFNMVNLSKKFLWLMLFVTV